MKKRKLFYAFEGTPAELRDCLIEHFKSEECRFDTIGGSTWNEGVEAGQRMAYAEVGRFLKKLVVNDSEHTEADNAAGQ